MSGQSNEGNPQGGSGAAEQPTSQASSSGSQLLPDYVTALQSQIADVTNLVKGIQKGTDKQIGQVRGDIKRILELSSKGLDEGAIQRELFIDQMMTGQNQNAPVQPPAGSELSKNTSLDVDTVVSSLQFQSNDPALAALKIKFSSDPLGLVKAAADLRLSQLQTPNPSPGTGLPPGGGQPNSPTNWDALANEYEELSKNPAANFKRMTEIQQEMEKLK